jgi:hypothetical protein
VEDAEGAGDQGSREGEPCGLAQVGGGGGGDEKWEELLDGFRVAAQKSKSTHLAGLTESDGCRRGYQVWGADIFVRPDDGKRKR